MPDAQRMSLWEDGVGMDRDLRVALSNVLRTWMRDFRNRSEMIRRADEYHRLANEEQQVERKQEVVSDTNVLLPELIVELRNVDVRGGQAVVDKLEGMIPLLERVIPQSTEPQIKLLNTTLKMKIAQTGYAVNTAEVKKVLLRLQAVAKPQEEGEAAGIDTILRAEIERAGQFEGMVSADIVEGFKDGLVGKTMRNVMTPELITNLATNRGVIDRLETSSVDFLLQGVPGQW